MMSGKLSHTLESLPRPQTGEEGKEGGGEEEEEEEEDVPQMYTNLLLSESRGELVGVTYDHNILFYDAISYKLKKQVPVYIICTHVHRCL